MRKIVTSFIAALVTFTIGVLLTVLWSEISPKRVSLCTLAGNPAAYDGKRVRVEAVGVALSSPFFSENDVVISEPGCGAPDAAWASVHLSPSFKSSPPIDGFISSTPGVREARVVVEGRFHQSAPSLCYAPPFSIQNATVKPVSPVTSKPLPGIAQRFCASCASLWPELVQLNHHDE